MGFVSPLDDEIIKEVIKAGRPIITVEDGTTTGGFGSAVLEWLADHDCNLPVHRIGIPRRFIPHGTVPELRAICRMDAPAIAEAITASLSKN